MKPKTLALILVAVVALPVVIWLSSLLKCELLTQRYYEDFERAYQQNTMLEEIEYFKVLRCNNKTAKVYYVSKDMTDGNVLTFERKNGTWVETSWDTVWSSTGSASDVIYPYWWHFIYGGF